MKKLILLAFIAFLLYCHIHLYLKLRNQPLHAKWNGQEFVCPAGTNVWASEPEALEGKQNYVYCVR